MQFPTKRLHIVAACFLLSACASWTQDSSTVLVRAAGDRHYSPPQPTRDRAVELWQYAVLSSNVYVRAEEKVSAITGKPPAEIRGDDALAPDCRDNRSLRMPLPGWEPWKDFPAPEKKQRWAKELGLNVEVWQTDTTPRTVAVVFEGTNFRSLPDWNANFRWILRFIPGHKDQYLAVSSEVAVDITDELARLYGTSDEFKSMRLIATGHSLGGGLAQHFAYVMPLNGGQGVPIPRVSQVYAFDPSPVTGWSAVPRELRAANAAALKIDRVFEHGEILAYVRLLFSYIAPPSSTSPAISETRFNFVRSPNPINSHSMYQLACDLSRAAG